MFAFTNGVAIGLGWLPLQNTLITGQYIDVRATNSKPNEVATRFMTKGRHIRSRGLMGDFKSNQLLRVLPKNGNRTTFAQGGLASPLSGRLYPFYLPNVIPVSILHSIGVKPSSLLPSSLTHVASDSEDSTSTLSSRLLYPLPSNQAISVPEYNFISDNRKALTLVVQIKQDFASIEYPAPDGSIIKQKQDVYVHVFLNGSPCTSRLVTGETLASSTSSLHTELFHGIRIGSCVEKAWVLSPDNRMPTNLLEDIEEPNSTASIEKRFVAIQAKLEKVILSPGSPHYYRSLHDYTFALQNAPIPVSGLSRCSNSFAVIDVVLVAGRRAKIKVQPTGSNGRLATTKLTHAQAFYQTSVGIAPRLLTAAPTIPKLQSTALLDAMSHESEPWQDVPEQSGGTAIIQRSISSNPVPINVGSSNSGDKPSAPEREGLQLRGGGNEHCNEQTEDTFSEYSVNKDDVQEFSTSRDSTNGGAVLQLNPNRSDSQSIIDTVADLPPRTTNYESEIQGTPVLQSTPTGRIPSQPECHHDRNSPSSGYTSSSPSGSEFQDLASVHENEGYKKFKEWPSPLSTINQRPQLKSHESLDDINDDRSLLSSPEDVEIDFPSALAQIRLREERPLSSIAQYPRPTHRLKLAIASKPTQQTFIDTRLISPARDKHDSDPATSPTSSETSEDTKARRAIKEDLTIPRKKRRVVFRSSDIDSEDAMATRPRPGNERKTRPVPHNLKPILDSSNSLMMGTKRKRDLDGEESQLVRPPFMKIIGKKGQANVVKRERQTGLTERDMLNWVKQQYDSFGGEKPMLPRQDNEDVPPTRQFDRDADNERVMLDDETVEESCWKAFQRSSVAEREIEEKDSLHGECVVSVSEDMLRACKDDKAYDFIGRQVIVGMRYILT